MRKLAPAASCFIGALLLTSLPTRAEQAKIVLRLADSFPASGHYFSEPGAKYFMETVREATNGLVEFQHYPAEQLGKAKDLLALTRSGVVDIGSVMPSYAADKMPLSAVGELPGMFNSSCEGTLAFWKLARDGVLAQKEFQPNGVRILFALVAAPYQLLMRQKIETVKNLEGKKIRALGSAVDLAMRQLNAIPIRMSAPEIYESLSRGTIDGTVISYVAAMSYDLGSLAKSVTTGQGFGSAVLTYSISETRWKGLPLSVQEAMLKAGDAATRRSCERMDKDTDTDLARLQKLGITAVTFSPDEQQDLTKLFAKVGTAWGDELDQRSKPGSEVLKAYQEAVQNLRKGQP
jgi:TRAP-type C4-dicarboxylate transport system substrate-binding protein